MNLLTDLLGVSVRKWPDKTALIDERSQVTYCELDRRINQVANGLSKLGIQKGDRVGLLMNNRIEMIEAFFALFRIGGIAVPINAIFQSQEIAYIIQDTEPKALIVEDAFVDKVMAAREEVLAVDHVIVVGKSTTDVLSYDRFRAEQPEECEIVDCDPDSLAILFYTSGTTGFPKGAIYTHWTTANISKGLVFVYHMQPEDRVLIASPCFYAMGLLTSLFPVLEIGATAILPGRFKAESAIEMMARHGVTVLPAVPTACQQLLDHYDPAKHSLKLRICLLSGSKPPAYLWPRLAEAFPNAALLEIYGATEAFLIGVTGFGMVRKDGAAGIPGANLIVKIVDDRDAEVPPGTQGEIACKGCTVTAGYWSKRETAASDFRKGWFYTGDVGIIDEDGYLSIVDRKKDIIVASGHNIHPVEVENVLQEHPGILDAAVVGLPDELKGEVPVAAVVLKQGYLLSEEEIIIYCRQHIASFKAPRRVYIVDQLPMTSSGKVIRRLLRHQLNEFNSEVAS